MNANDPNALNDLAAAGGPAPEKDVAKVLACPSLPAAAAPYIVSEIGLAKKIGVNRKALRKLRDHFRRGYDWTTIGKSIVWTEPAAQQAARMLAPPNHDPAGTNALQPQMVNENEPLRELMKVIRWRIPNPHLIECERDVQSPEARVFVRVSSNRNFRDGMTVRAQLDNDGWTLMGRCPRFPGRW